MTHLAHRIWTLRPWHGPFSLTRWFSVLSLFCIVLACVISSYLLSGFLTAHMLQRDGAIMLEFVQSVMDIENAKARDAGREPDVRDPMMRELFDHLSGVPQMLRTNIYAADQTLAWSSEKNLIGKRFTDNHELEEALKGKLEVEIGVTSRHEHPKHEHWFLSDDPVRFVETYLPLRDKKSGRVIGVAELYRIPSALFDTIERGQRLIWITGLLSGFMLYALLFWIVRRADGIIRSQQLRLVESETLAAVGEMGSAVAHGIRNPLASIRSSAELLVDDNAAPEVRASANDIIGLVDRMEKWLRDLLSYAQPDASGKGRVELSTLLEIVNDQFARDLERTGIRRVIRTPAALPAVAGDEAAFEQVFASVVANAVEAMPRGGLLTITAEPKAHDKIQVIIGDTGKGIPPDQQSKLFTAFHTTKPKGMGLGLALVRRIVRRHGGEVLIHSVEGQGTSVTLTFAVARPEA